MAKLSHFISDKNKQLDLHRIYVEELCNIHMGQGYDIHWHNGDKIPTEKQYNEMVKNKTGVLPRLNMRMICSVMGQSEKKTKAILDYTDAVGTAFQIQDDILSVASEKYSAQRGIIAEDIHEGKKTLMVIHAVS